MTSAPPSRTALLQLGGRSDLAFHDLHGEPMYMHALRGMAEVFGHVLVVADALDVDRVGAEAARAGISVDLVRTEHAWTRARDSASRGLLIHDALCPLAPAAYLRTFAERADAAPESAFVAVRPITDTIKAVIDGQITGTVDREDLVSVTSPLVIPAGVLAEEPPLLDFSGTVRWLRERVHVELVRAPSLGRRVENARGVRLLECLDEVGHRVRASGPAVSATEQRP